MTSYTAIANTAIDVDSPITTGLMTKMRDNPIAIAERASGAPWLNGIGAMELITTSSTWNVPTGVYFAKVTVIGGGGSGGGNSDGGNGGTTSFGSYLSATGGSKGLAEGAVDGTFVSGGLAGAGSNGTINGYGQDGGYGYKGTGFADVAGYGGNSLHLGAATNTNSRGRGAGGPGGANTGGSGGGGGGWAIEIIDLTAVTSVSVTIGAGSTTGDGGDGIAGCVIIEY